MTATILLIAPHPDDETLGCGGTLLRHHRQGDRIIWLLATTMTEAAGYSAQAIRKREAIIEEVAAFYGFADLIRLNFAPASLDTVPVSQLVSALQKGIKPLRPTQIYLPYPGDVHTDHGALFTAAASCTKWFRFPSIQRVLAYETPSETNFQIRPDLAIFRPNYSVDIQPTLDNKMAVLNLYYEELGHFPFPRSPEAVHALALLRGSEAGFEAAEAFMLLMERVATP